ncbi:hypothetical protein H3H36_12095 [Duganella sp. FT3S]|uniref:Photosynthesis system II assembly factor Ycf48/Hcf136-like domain-containing protein n=1 Tax=Rugamonas fusca TaxID=2758568 RepID=A0A7W2EHP1_9BURK|nr:YCF48-related protein [Rugamonas fusca]MBA5606098.1 hypothetical protein [Rugamonas fusca]
MFTSLSRNRRAAAVSLAYGLVCGLASTVTDAIAANAPAENGVDLLARPAVIRQHADTSVMLAVASAGARLVAVGERGIILLSDDQGKTWRQTPAPVSVALTAVHFPDAQHGWAVGHGGAVLATTDGGATWHKQLDGLLAAQIELASAREHAPQDGEAGVSRLRDAERMLTEGADKPWLDVRFSDARHGLVVGAYGMALATVDGGATWTTLRGQIDNPRGHHLYRIYTGGGHTWLAGEQGALYRAADGTAIFQEIKTPYAGSYFGMVTGRHSELLLFGLRGNAFRSTDGGANWSKVDTGLPITLTAGQRLASGDIVLADETGRVLKSRDDGASFAPVPLSQRASFTGVAQSADGSLVLSGTRGMVRIAAETVLGVKK